LTLHPNDSPGFLLWHATLRWQRAITNALRSLDLTHVQFVLLACTWWMNERAAHPSQVELAAQAGTDIKMTSAVARELVRKGLIERAVDPNDTRAFRLAVTPRGRRLAKLAITVVERADRTFFEVVPKSDVLPLLRTLARFHPPKDLSRNARE
jgi:DNA-binding MarR family transcriptional regulator